MARVGSKGCMIVQLFIISWGNSIPCAIMVVLIYISFLIVWVSCCPRPLQHLLTFLFLWNPFQQLWDYLILVLTCISLAFSDAEHFFIYLLAIYMGAYIFIWEISVQILYPLSHLFSCYCASWVPYIFWWWSNYFLPFCGLSVCFLNYFLCCTELFKFYTIPFVCFYFCFLCFQGHIQTITTQNSAMEHYPFVVI